jgi:hypothetical protein
MKIGSLYKANLELNITLAGTITHAGKILAAILPPLPPSSNPVFGKEYINHALTGPHGFLHANEATSITLPVPWYCNSDLATLEMDTSVTTTLDITPENGNYGTLLLIVMNPLSPSSGSSNSLVLTIEAVFRALDVVVPTPRFVKWVPQSSFGKAMTGLKNSLVSPVKSFAGDFIDKAANSLFSFIGLHNPNIPTLAERDIIISRNLPNTSDAPQFFEKLDPYTQFDRIMQSPLFGSEVDEMATSYVTNKRQFIGSFVVKDTDPIGTLKWIRPISPQQGGISLSSYQLYCANNLELMHSLHRAWRGDLEIIIESVMNNKQNVRLRVLKMYNPTIDCLSNSPTYESIANAPSALLTYTGGGQEHVISLPYLCRNDLTPCSENLNFEALFHGLYYIYVAQPLANSDGSPTTIEFNVYIKGTDSLSFYGYPVKDLIPAAFPLIPVNIPMSEPVFSPQSKIEVMNRSQPQDTSISKDDKVGVSLHTERLFKNVDIRNLIRRMYKTKASVGIALQPNAIFDNIVPLNRFIGETAYTQDVADASTPITHISRMYYSKSVGFKFQLALQAFNKTGFPTNVQTTIFYVPPNMDFDGTATVIGSPVNPSMIEPVPLPTFLTPLNFVEIPAIDDNIRLFEFTIPDVTLYKFMGSPMKYYAQPPIYPESYSTNDFGSLYIRYTNTDEQEIQFKSNFIFGLTDESRFGHHTMAVPFYIDKKYGPYVTDVFKAPGIYFGGFL